MVSSFIARFAKARIRIEFLLPTPTIHYRRLYYVAVGVTSAPQITYSWLIIALYFGFLPRIIHSHYISVFLCLSSVCHRYYPVERAPDTAGHLAPIDNDPWMSLVGIRRPWMSFFFCWKYCVISSLCLIRVLLSGAAITCTTLNQQLTGSTVLSLILLGQSTVHRHPSLLVSSVYFVSGQLPWVCSMVAASFLFWGPAIGDVHPWN
ncbi:hypothetical protein K438DRAFT_1932454, partial [Mycena galopus ATCC 62051]